MKSEGSQAASHGSAFSLKMALVVALAVLITIAAVAAIEEVAKVSDALHRWASLIQHSFVTLLVVFVFHAIDKFQTEKSTAGILGDIQVELESQLRKVIPYGVAAKELGLVGLYPSRRHAMEAVRERIQRAEKKIRLLGVAFKEQLELSRDAGGISAELRNFAVRHAGEDGMQILVLHPLTSPAVFRAFLETPASIVAQILRYHAQDPAAPGAATYFDTQLFADCNLTRLNLDGNESQLAKCVRYYRRDPTLWMILIDDEVFVESYTFGRSDDQKEASQNTMRLGGHMPVFRFRGYDIAPYKILDDHFTRLWATSTDSLPDLARQLDPAKREQNINDWVFDQRREWLNKVAAALADLEARKKP
ncbi:MAG: hypothetical protein JNL30_00105 [Rubrivivax sp.]|nr:hypothetical protein [Rubrivivax sp.]